MSKTNPIEHVLDGIVAAADKDMRQKSISYRDLSANADSDIQSLFDIYDLATSDVVHSMTAVLKERWKITRMSDELYIFIRDFPKNLHDLSKEIEATEGMVCCVDKAWSRLLKQLPDLIEASGGELPAQGGRS